LYLVPCTLGEVCLGGYHAAFNACFQYSQHFGLKKKQ
jgi:hypothetical protein